MKTPYNFMLALALLMLAVSCNDDDKKPNNDSPIFGEWRLTGWYDDTPKDIDSDGNASTDLYLQWNGCYKHNHLEINSNNTFRNIYKGNPENANCNTGQLTVMPSPCQIKQNSNSTEFIIVGDDYFDSYNVVQADDTTLVLEGSGLMTCCNSEIGYYTGGYLKFTRVR